jgi:hypothetical protein
LKSEVLEWITEANPSESSALLFSVEVEKKKANFSVIGSPWFWGWFFNSFV